MMITHLDLFSGIGGFALASNKAGFETVGFSEIDRFCAEVLKKHWPMIENLGDIKKLKFNRHVNLMTGGFPCQPFSIAGNRKGKEDDRYLWHEFYRIIKESKPCWAVIENVTGLISMELDNILADLENEGYEAKTLVLPACAANAPHRRNRVWIIANCPSERCLNCGNCGKTRFLQSNKEWDITSIQQEWEEFKPVSWKVNKAKNWLDFNTRANRRNNGISQGVDRIKALGNAIVPQVVFPILKIIFLIESNYLRGYGDQ
jgi:DNA (cytosine-5)-methyltransferase 1